MTDAFWALLAVVGLTWLGVMLGQFTAWALVRCGVWIADREDDR